MSCDLCDDTGPLSLRAKCHPTAPLRAEIKDQVLVLSCYVPSCAREVVRFELPSLEAPEPTPIPMLLWCPSCGARHFDEGEFATKAHHTHACQACGMVWRPAIEPTCGVQFLPGFKNESGT